MGLPVMMVVDDDGAVLASVEAQLRERYGASYRIECPADATVASVLLDQLAESGADLALFLVGHSIHAGTGGHLFDQARRAHAQAKRALLVPRDMWYDPLRSEPIRAAMAMGRIDHFVIEPGPAPDEVFHEAISSFLLEWARERRAVPTVTVVGEDWTGRAYEIRSVLENCVISHEFCLADSARGRELLEKVGPDARLPLMVLPDGSSISDPSDIEMAILAGAPTSFDETTYDLLVVGAGPAGLSAAVYGASEGLRVLVVDSGGIGGQARSSSLIRNYLGFARGVSGGRLAQQAYEQASLFGAEFLFFHRASELVLEDDGLMTLRIADGPAVSTRAVILATGASYRRLGIPSLEALIGAGVFYGGPVSEAPTLAGKDVFVVGGGNSAAQAALHLARYARQVTLVVRANSLGAAMSQYLVRAVEAAPGIVVRTETAVCGGGGDGRLEHLVLCDAAGGGQTLPADALFVLIGARPLTGWLPPAIARDRHGFLLAGEDVREGWPLARRPYPQETSVPRVFAAGDARHGSIKRVAAAVGEGASVVQAVHQVLDELEPPVERVA
jgi:thioredoxin reductase (NADPH)